MVNSGIAQENSLENSPSGLSLTFRMFCVSLGSYVRASVCGQSPHNYEFMAESAQWSCRKAINPQRVKISFLLLAKTPRLVQKRKVSSFRMRVFA